MAAIGIGGQIVTRQLPRASQALQQTLKTVMQGSWANAKYYKGGFEPKTSRPVSLKDLPLDQRNKSCSFQGILLSEIFTYFVVIQCTIVYLTGPTIASLNMKQNYQFLQSEVHTYCYFLSINRLN